MGSEFFPSHQPTHYSHRLLDLFLHFLPIINVFLKIFILRVWMFSLHKCLCAAYVPGTHRDQKRTLDDLELELLVVVNSHVDAENQIQAFWKSSQCS